MLCVAIVTGILKECVEWQARVSPNRPQKSVVFHEATASNGDTANRWIMYIGVVSNDVESVTLSTHGNKNDNSCVRERDRESSCEILLLR